MDTWKYSVEKANVGQLFNIPTDQTKPNSNAKTAG